MGSWANSNAAMDPPAHCNPAEDRRRQQLLETLNSCSHGVEMCDACYRGGRAQCSTACAECHILGLGCVVTVAVDHAPVDHTERKTIDGTARCKFCQATGLHWLQGKTGKWYLATKQEVTRWDSGGPVTTDETSPHFKECRRS